jgi:drug/metabolite transporter (DMT)-like permease
LAKALTLAFVAPLIVTAFSPLFLGEKVGFRRWTAVIIGFIGSLIVIRPGFLEINLASLAALATWNYVRFLFNNYSKIEYK